MSTALIMGLIVGTGIGLILGAWLASHREECPTCHGDRVTIYAGGMGEDGMCELRSCGTCGTGERLGRSDVPIVTMRQLLDGE